MKAVLLSVKPKYCELIANGSKTIEVRKTRPKLEVPFKVYIYETKESKRTFYNHRFNSSSRGKSHHTEMGKVIGEFVCDYIDYVKNWGDYVDSYDCIASCLTANEIIEYAKDKNGNFVYTYGWHISNLVIYDKPKELSEFSKPYGTIIKAFESKFIQRPPQIYCYVEELR